MPSLQREKQIFQIYLSVAVLALGWRALALPWDWGGLFTQSIWTFFGLALFLAKRMPARGKLEEFMYSALFIASCLLWFMQTNYAPQAVGPFIITCFVLVLIWGGERKVRAKVFNTLWLVLPLGGLIYYGLGNTISIYRLRHVRPEQVREIELVSLAPGDQGGKKIELSAQSDVAKFAAALRSSTPYLPNHDSWDSPLQVTIMFNSGGSLDVKVVKGTGSNPDTCRLRLGVTTYQNQPLCQLLQSLDPQLPWSGKNKD